MATDGGALDRARRQRGSAARTTPGVEGATMQHQPADRRGREPAARQRGHDGHGGCGNHIYNHSHSVGPVSIPSTSARSQRGVEMPLPSSTAVAETDAAAATDPVARESEVREALRQVVDPEINLDVVTLGLIREIVFHLDHTDVRMILTTPFCPYAGMLVQQVKDVTRMVTLGEAKVTLLDEPRWSPDLMEGGDWGEWGLI
ncbi:hypothetical protein DCC79_08510 [bacterium]|nr:MAG: hypothetical protein DCC79_08510 [bacterium]